MSLTVTLLTFDLSILPILIHGLFTLILLRRLLLDKILYIFFFTNFYVELEERFLSLSRKFWRYFNRSGTSMGSRSPRDKKVQETGADGAEVESRKRQSLRKNSTTGSSASVQAKMSLDLIVEQLKREMSLKNIEDESKDDKRIKARETRENENIVRKDSMESELTRVTANEASAKSENLSEKKSEEALEREYGLEDTEKSLKETSRCVTETTDLTVKDVPKNFEELVEEREIKDLHQRATTILSREPVVKAYGKEEENLYGLIRSMIAAEVKRYEERERRIVRKVHSDTIDIVGRRTNKRKLSLFNNENSYSREMERESHDTSSIKISKRVVVEKRSSPVDTIKSKVMMNHHLPRKENDTSVGVSTAFVLERKHDLGKSFGCRVEGKKINEGENISTREREKVSSNRETQTEREYTIRTVRSCPVRRRSGGGAGGEISRVLFDARQQRCGFTGWIHRKASDNLIYEKGKASGSPSYVPLTQRFRWRYVRPKKAR